MKVTFQSTWRVVSRALSFTIDLAEGYLRAQVLHLFCPSFPPRGINVFLCCYRVSIIIILMAA